MIEEGKLLDTAQSLNIDQLLSLQCIISILKLGLPTEKGAKKYFQQ